MGGYLTNGSKVLDSNEGDDLHMWYLCCFPPESKLFIISLFPLFYSAKFEQGGAFYSGCWII